MNYREYLLRLLRLQPKLLSLAYDKLYYWFFFNLFFGSYIDFIGKAKIRVHCSTRLNILDSRIIIENGVLSVGYDPILDTKGACGLGLIHSTLRITGSVELRPGANIWAEDACVIIGDGTVINGPTSIISRAGISLGAYCHIAMNTMIMDCDLHKHAFAGETPQDIAKEIVIKDHCWVGHNVTILKGVTIGEGSIIGAHSVVTKDVEDRTIVAGVPARKIKDNIIWEP